MAWLYLIVAGLLEMGWAVSMKYSEGFTRFWPSLVTLVLMTVSVVLLAIAVKTIPLGTGYAVWTGIGAIGTAVVGIVVLQESRDLPRILCLLLIFAGIIGLKFFTREEPQV